ncbi:MAG TPA: hypothetical protein VFK04_12895 [Gemmatimonadaceae bacterium]|nr:hypothetical protein [Gemmatimonadaceae bacterium]
MRPSERIGSDASASPIESAPSPEVIRLGGVLAVRWSDWIALDVPLVCAAHHKIRGTRHVHRGAHRCYHRAPDGATSGPECGLYSYAVTVREISQRFLVQVVPQEIEILDRMSEAGILAHFRAAWPTAA